MGENYSGKYNAGNLPLTPRASYPFPFSLVKTWEKYGENPSAKI